MAKHMVKCLYCGEMFDINSEPYIKPRSNRYAHVACEKTSEGNNQQKTQEEKDFEQLSSYIVQLFGNPAPRVWKQVQEYKKVYGYTYSGMYKTLVWWFEINHGDLEKAHGGVGIIPYVYNEASQYYYALYIAQNANANIDINNITTTTREFTIEIPRTKKQKHKLFKFREEEGEIE